MSLCNRAQYLHHILANPSTDRETYLWAQRELYGIEAHQQYVNDIADKYHNGNDKLTGGQNV
jgi:hypothetical protein